MSIASEITRLQGVKADILTAIADKGVTVPAGSALDDCPSLIGDIEQGGNGLTSWDESYITYADQGASCYGTKITSDEIYMPPNDDGTLGFSLYPGIPLIPGSMINKFEINIAYNNIGSGNNNCNLIGPPSDFANNAGTASAEIFGLTYNGSSISIRFCGATVSTLNPKYLSTPSANGGKLTFEFDRATGKINITNTGNYAWTYSVNVTASNIDNKLVGISIGGNSDGTTTTGRCHPGTRLYRNGTNIKVNGTCVWGDERPETYRIGDKDYACKLMPGGKIWMCKNLDYAWEGLDVGSSGTSSSIQKANYYNNDAGTYGPSGRDCGLLYNHKAVEYLNSNVPGWRVPTYSECNSMISSITSASNYKLRKYVSWANSSWKEYSYDIFGFGMIPNGGVLFDSYSDNGASGFLWSNDSGKGLSFYFNYAAVQTFQGWGDEREVAVRLVKDL